MNEDMLSATTEIRWFWPIDDEKEPLAWFESQAGQAAFEERIDQYLLLPGCRTAGIKLRGELFEVKLLLDEVEAVEVTDSCRGRIQSWLKWTVANPLVNEWLTKEESWIRLRKQRYQHYFLGQHGRVERLSSNDASRANCRVEITHLSLQEINTDWLSLCVEADGESESSAQSVRAVLQELSRQAEVWPKLPTSAASQSYPEWLAELHHQQGRV